ncbi:MAG: 50S ribosomal protein L31 [Planctomycetota bacterium]|jgi:large subunit ribosomal protein L31|nr:50S ribosomal protein L31 [Planctomycetota bacterium]
MKAKIHPKYQEVTVRCACGNEFRTKSTKNEIRLALCNACHPFFTGKQKFVDTAGRIEKFQKRFNLEEGASTADIVKGRKTLSKKQVQSAAIQEEKRLKAARRARVSAPGQTAPGQPGAAAAPAETASAGEAPAEA